MEITIRNITKDTMVDFNNDYIITLPMDEEKLRNMLGTDEWIIVDSPVGDELTNIIQLNDLFNDHEEGTVELLSRHYLLNEIMENDFIIINFDEETQEYNNGNGVFADEWWKGYVLHDFGYEHFPFKYKPEMEDYLKFEQLWYTAESEGWVDIKHNGNTYLVRKVG